MAFDSVLWNSINQFECICDVVDGEKGVRSRQYCLFVEYIFCFILKLKKKKGKMFYVILIYLNFQAKSCRQS